MIDDTTSITRDTVIPGWRVHEAQIQGACPDALEWLRAYPRTLGELLDERGDWAFWAATKGLLEGYEYCRDDWSEMHWAQLMIMGRVPMDIARLSKQYARRVATYTKVAFRAEDIAENTHHWGYLMCARPDMVPVDWEKLRQPDGKHDWYWVERVCSSRLSPSEWPTWLPQDMVKDLMMQLCMPTDTGE